MGDLGKILDIAERLVEWVLKPQLSLVWAEHLHVTDLRASMDIPAAQQAQAEAGQASQTKKTRQWLVVDVKDRTRPDGPGCKGGFERTANLDVGHRQVRSLGSWLIPHRHSARGELAPADELQVDGL